MTRKEAMRQTLQQDVLMALGFTQGETEQLRRISMTLHRWFEHECNGAIQREGDDGNGRPYWCNTHTGERTRTPVADREAGAMKRLNTIIRERDKRANDPLKPVGYYVQTDPRGAALYILRPGDVPAGADVSAYYSRGICVY